MESNQDMKKSAYLIYAALFVIILILAGVTITFAYYRSQTSTSTTPTNFAATVDCFDISYNEINIINLDYNYPITDEYAVNNITPITVKVTNNCTNNLENIDYTLALTSLSNDEKYISDDKIRMYVTRKIESEGVYLEADYLSDLTHLDSGNAFININNDLDIRDGISGYKNRNSYVIDSSNLSNGITIIYNIYLWVDYYEGDKDVYNGAEHDTSYDNSTEGQQFLAAISLLVNNSVEIAHRLPDEYQEVEYIQSSGKQYLEIDFKANQDTKTKAKFQVINTTDSGEVLFGSRISSTRDFYGFNWMGGPNFYIYNSYYNNPRTKVGINTEIHTLFKDKGVLYLDDAIIHTNTNTTSFTTPYNMIIFGCNTNGTLGLFSSAKMFYFQFYENDALKVDLVPCYRKTDSIAGMYDLVNDVFYTNKGTGSFIVGHNVS